jgi:hypothetical protein
MVAELSWRRSVRTRSAVRRARAVAGSGVDKAKTNIPVAAATGLPWGTSLDTAARNY